MCDPVTAGLVIMGVGAAASGAAAYKQTRDNNKNMKRMQEAKNDQFRQQMERQRGYADEAGKAFDTSIEDRGADNFKLGLEDATQSRMNSFDSGKLALPTDYAINSAPKNVQLYQDKVLGQADDINTRDTGNLAKLNAFNDTIFNKNINRNNYARAFGNLSDTAQRDAGLLNLDMNAAAFNAYKPTSPWWSVLGGAGGLASQGGAFMAGSGSGAKAAGATSDKRLKQNIVKVGESPSGINIYEFEYKDKPGQKFRGVIAQELLDEFPEAVIKDNDGMLSVDYSRIDVNFEKL